MTPFRSIARPLLASVFLYGGVNAFKNSGAMAARAKPMVDKMAPLVDQSMPIPTDPETLVKLNAATQVLAGAALATGRAPRLASAVLAASLVPTTIAEHAFWNETDPKAKATQRMQFIKNLSTLGGLLLASADTEGRPGVAWRARHVATDVTREARHLGKTAKLEAKLAAKGLG